MGQSWDGCAAWPNLPSGCQGSVHGLACSMWTIIIRTPCSSAFVISSSRATGSGGCSRPSNTGTSVSHQVSLLFGPTLGLDPGNKNPKASLGSPRCPRFPLLLPFLHTPCLGKSTQALRRLSPSQPGDGTPETLCPCPSIQARPLFPEMSSSSALSSIPHFFGDPARIPGFRPDALQGGTQLCIPQLSRPPLRPLKPLSVYTHPIPLLCLLLGSPVSRVLSVPIWTVHHCSQHSRFPALGNLTSLPPRSCPPESWCSFFSHFDATPCPSQAVFLTTSEKDKDSCCLPPICLL